MHNGSFLVSTTEAKIYGLIFHLWEYSLSAQTKKNVTSGLAGLQTPSNSKSSIIAPWYIRFTSCIFFQVIYMRSTAKKCAFQYAIFHN